MVETLRKIDSKAKPPFPTSEPPVEAWDFSISSKIVIPNVNVVICLAGVASASGGVSAHIAPAGSGWCSPGVLILPEKGLWHKPTLAGDPVSRRES